MAVPNWICLECKKEFNPMKDNGDFSFNCPVCGSPKTVSLRLNGKNNETESEKNKTSSK